MHNLTFSLLGAISSIEIKEDSPAEQELNKLRDLIKKNLQPALRASSYVAKNRIILALEQCLNDARTLCAYPQLLGKTLVGIVSTSKSEALDALGGECSLWNRKTTLPRLLTTALGKTALEIISANGKAVNLDALPGHPKDTPNELTAEELDTLFALDNVDINASALCAGLHCHVPLNFVNMAFLILHPDAMGQSDRLLAQCDALIIIGKPANGKCLQHLRDDFNMPVYLLVDDDVNNEANYLRSRYAGRMVTQKSPRDLTKVLDSLSVPTERIVLKDQLLSELLAVEEELVNTIARREALLNSLNQDLLGAENKKTSENFTSHQNTLKQDIEKLKEQKRKFAAAASEVLDAAEAFEKNLRDGQSCDLDGNFRLWAGTQRPGAMWRRIILRSLSAGNTRQAIKYQDKYDKLFPEQAFITGLYLDDRLGRNLGRDKIEKLRSLPDSPEVLRAKIFFRRQLDLSEDDCVKIVRILPKPKTPDEIYYWALHQYALYQEGKKTGAVDALKFESVLQAFQEAVLAGSEDAANMFAQYCGAEGKFEEAQAMADMGIPFAAWVYRLLSLTRKDALGAKRYLNLAAALGYEKAILAVAENVWKNRIPGKYPDFDRQNGVLHGLDDSLIHAGAQIYENLIRARIGAIPNANERLGYFYFCSRQWRASREVLGSNPVTTEGIFCISVMLRYGHGGNRDEDEAVRQIRRAEGGSGPYAEYARYVKSIWYEEERARI